MPRIVRKKQRRAGGNRAQSAFQNECQYALIPAREIIRNYFVSRLRLVSKSPIQNQLFLSTSFLMRW